MRKRLPPRSRKLRVMTIVAVLLLLPGPSVLAQQESPGAVESAAAGTPPPTASPSDAALETPAAADEALPVPVAGTVLEPGRYADASIGRPYTFEVDEGWTSQGAIPGAGVALIEDTEVGPYIAFVPFDGTVFSEPCRTTDDIDAFGPAATAIETTPEAFLAYLEGHPFLTLSEPVPVEIGGLSGLQVDVTTSVPDDCDPPWAWLWVLPVVGDYHLTEDVAARIVALDGGDAVVALVAEVAAGDDVASLLERAMTVFESVEFPEAS